MSTLGNTITPIPNIQKTDKGIIVKPYVYYIDRETYNETTELNSLFTDEYEGCGEHVHILKEEFNLLTLDLIEWCSEFCVQIGVDELGYWRSERFIRTFFKKVCYFESDNGTYVLESYNSLTNEIKLKEV